MTSDEIDKKSDEENTKNNSTDENDEKNDIDVKTTKESKAASKKKGTEPPKIKQPAKKRVKSEEAEKESKKKEKEKPEDTGNDESDAEDESAKGVPLLDQPLEISGKRQRKEIERFVPPVIEKEVPIPKGNGKALGTIKIISHNIQRANPEDLKLLHRLCFGVPGKAAIVKQNIRKFSGWEFEEASDDYERKKNKIQTSKKVFVGQLKDVCNILDLTRSGTRDDIIDRILSYLNSPVDSGKKVPGGERSKRKSASSKNYNEGDQTYKTKKKNKSPKKKKENSDESEEEQDESDEDKKEEVIKNDTKKDDASEVSESEEEEKKVVEKPTKNGKKAKKTNDAEDKKAPPKKRAAAKKAAEKVESEAEDKSAGEDESDDEEPLIKKTKSPPTEEEIKTYVKGLLDGADLEQITMKKVCQDVYAHYPDFDLSHKKDFIKTTVKNLISS